MITIANVYKCFGSYAAVDGVTLEIFKGEFFSLLGPSGCGKTTLLRMIGGFELPSSGEISIDGNVMGNRRAHERPTNMVFQSYALFPHLTVEENIGYGLLNQHISRMDRQRTIAEALQLVRLTNLGERLPHQISGGQRQRVALARALVCKPKVLLLDEPLGALDKALREEMQSELRLLQKNVGITFVFVTHDQEEAMALSDRIAVMSYGRLLQVGPPEDVYQRPASMEIAKFIGKANLLKGLIVKVEGDVATFMIEGLGVVQLELANKLFTAGESACLLLRPEEIKISSERPAGKLNSFKGRVSTRTFLGALERMEVELGVVKVLTVAAAGGSEPTDDLVWLSWPFETGKLLQLQTGSLECRH